jgi:hypothetical protein
MWVDWVRVRHSGGQWIPGDFDEDEDVDEDDIQLFIPCRTGCNVQPPDPGCEDMDLDYDQDVDQSDFGLLQRCISGPDIPADPTCAD